MITVRCRPLDAPWRGPETVDRRPHPFRASWQDTLDLVDRELRALNAEVAVLEAGFVETDLRVDGWPRANARQPEFPGVRLSFDTQHGRLVYATDVYGPSWSGKLHAWQANLRAIALGLEALRAVDRHGITRSGEQYTGFRAIGAGSAPPPLTVPAMSPNEAARTLLDAAGWDPAMVNVLLDSADTRKAAYRLAAKATHPEAGGDAVSFARVAQAWEVLNR